MFTIDLLSAYLARRTLCPIGPWHVLGPAATLDSFWTGAPQPSTLCLHNIQMLTVNLNNS